MSTWDWNHQNFSDNTRATVLIIQMTVKEQRSRRDTEAMKHLFDLQVRNHKRSQVTWWELAYYQDVDPSLWLLYCRMNSFIFNWSVIKSSPLTQSETEQFTDHLFTLTSQLQSSLTVDLLMWQTVEVMRVLLFNLISSRRETTDLLLCSQQPAWCRVIQKTEQVSRMPHQTLFSVHKEKYGETFGELWAAFKISAIHPAVSFFFFLVEHRR